MAMDDRAIIEQYRQVLGRDPNQAEIEYFNSFLGENNIHPSEIGQILQSHPEYQQNLLTKQGSQYEELLGKSDQRILSLGQDQLRGDFTRMGRPASSGYASAFANKTADLAAQRQQSLASFYGGGYGGIRELAAGQGQQALGRGYDLATEKRKRGYQIDDFYMQQNSFNDYLNQQKRSSRQGALGRTIAGGVGAGIGAFYGGPAGAQAGAGIGSNLGGLFGG